MSNERREAELMVAIVITFAFVTLISGSAPEDLKEVILATLQAVEANAWPAALVAIASKCITQFGGKK